MTGTLHEDQHTIFYHSRSAPLAVRNVSSKRCKGTQNTPFTCSNSPAENRALYEIKWKNIVEPGRPQTAI